jgi:iron complex outermembrane receptor protein
VVITGSILRQKNLETNAPLTIESAVSLESRGITTIQDAVQELSGNNSGALPNDFGGAFAHGASGASLRGLTTDSTLVLIDGLRAAYYPLSDDGERNFVDLNTIPDIVLDRVEVLQDGASSTYGADAVAGVINVITKRNFQGFQGTTEGGFAQHGGAGHAQLSAIGGTGDLETDGWNGYLAAEYQRDNALFNRERGRLYNTADQSYYCGADYNGLKVCRNNGIVNGLQFDGSFRGVGSDIVPVVRAVNGAGSSIGNYQLLNPAAGCGRLTPVTITPGEAKVGGFSAPVNLCQQDLTHDYSLIAPERSRVSMDGRFTKKLWDGAEGYVEFNLYGEDITTSGAPNSIRAKTPPGPSGNQVSGTTFFLPVWICASGVNCATDPTHTLNPNNPFAASGHRAALFYRFWDTPVSSDERDYVTRFAGGINGTWGQGWNYRVDGVYMFDYMDWARQGQISVAGIQQAINTGAYNFLNPSQNSSAVRNLISPVDEIRPHTYESEVNASLNKNFWELQGGPAQAGVGASFRSEGLYDPTANPEQANGVTSFFGTNAFAAQGSRTVASAYYEVDLPFFTQLDVDTSGRYDHYSTRQSNFSPKIGVKYKPVDQLMLRATYSTGFRIASFAETGAAPTTGYLTYNAPIAFQALHGNDGYGNNYAVGSVAISNPNLHPETSTNFTAGMVWQPTHDLAFTLDYFRIEKKNVVVGAPCYGDALYNYYHNNYQMVTGACQIRLGDPDPNFPAAPATASYVTQPFVNADSQLVDGIDFSASLRHDLWGAAHLTSTLNGTYLNRFNQVDAGQTQQFAGTQGPNNPTAGSGSPRLRLNWVNTFDFGRFGLTASVYYTSGMKAIAEDVGSFGCANTAAQAGNETPGDSWAYGVPGADTSAPIICRTKAFTDVDLHGRFDVTSHIQLYGDILNVFDAPPPFDPSSYAGTNYQPAWGQAGILGRFFKVGVKAKF